MLDNANQTLNLGGASGANVTLTAPNSGNINVTLPSNGGTLATTTGPTPIAIDPFAADLEGVTTLNVVPT